MQVQLDLRVQDGAGGSRGKNAYGGASGWCSVDVGGRGNQRCGARTSLRVACEVLLAGGDTAQRLCCRL